MPLGQYQLFVITANKILILIHYAARENWPRVLHRVLSVHRSQTTNHLGVYFSKLLEHASVHLFLAVVNLFDLVVGDDQLVLGSFVVWVDIQNCLEVSHSLVKIL